MASMVVVGKKKAKSPGLPSGKAHHISIELHEGGGATITSRHKGKKKKAPSGAMALNPGMGGTESAPDEEHTAAFGAENMQGASDHVNGLMGVSAPAAPAASAPPAPGAEDEEEGEEEGD